MAAIEKRAFALFCVEQAARFGVNSHYLIAVAQLRSGISGGSIDGSVGPYGFTPEQWGKAIERVARDTEALAVRPSEWTGPPRTVTEIEPVHADAVDIASWRMQCQVFAALTARTERTLAKRYRRNPEAAEAYCLQLAVPTEEHENAATRLGEALDLTRRLLAEVTFDLPPSRIADLSVGSPKGEVILMSAGAPATTSGYLTPLAQGVKSGQYRVWYATNRRPEDPSDITKGYSSDPDTKVHYGQCVVFVPASHIIGSFGSPWWLRVLRGADDRLRLLNVRAQQEPDFWEAVTQQWAFLDPWDRHAVIFVHGYNVTFQEAALRAAQLGYDLSVNGAMAFFSWPSQGRKRDYPVDADAIEQSEQHITDFMIDFATKSGADSVHVIAHSMGNRGVLRAVNRIAENAEQQSGVPFGQVILAAADVSQNTFRRLCGAYPRVAQRTTLYVSKGDLAIGASRWLHKFARVGILPPVFIAPGIDTINVTNVDLSLLGHGYYAEARSVLQDMYQLISGGSPPERRFGLRRDTTDAGERFWSLGK